jgi:hypothetical protein
VRSFATLVAERCDTACREAVVLAASELAENQVKYGVADPSGIAGMISIRLAPDLVRIRAVNNAKNHDDVTAVMSMISKIGSSQSVMGLYRERLRELFDTPHMPRAQLGLLRIAFECGFRLSCSYEPPRIEITAEGPCRALQ